MKTKEEKLKRGAYLRQWRAQSHWNLVRARAAAGLDISTGWRPSELVQYAKLSFMVRDVEYKALSGGNRNEVDDDFNIARLEIGGELDNESLTEEYRAALLKLSTEAAQAYYRFLAAANTDHLPTDTSEVDAYDN